MRVYLLYFGILKELFGGERDSVELPEGADVAALLNLLRLRPKSNPTIFHSLAVAVNREYAQAGTPLADGDEVALLPPVSGGSAPFYQTAGPSMRIEILDHALPVAEVIAQIKAGPDGAVCTFDGIVRDNTRGRRTLYLDYEAYREMALEQMRSLAAQALEKFAVRDVAMLHRLGRIEVGETSVLIVVASAHRGAAFDACRWLIDTLKQQVPIWKKETFVDGAVWADGETFPEGISVP
jgi:molybdopterin synthase catalytic subunit